MHLPVTLITRSSRSLATAMVLAHGVVAAALAPTALPIVAKVPILLALGLSLVLTRRRRSQIALTLRPDGCLSVADPGGEPVLAEVLPATTVLPWLVILLMRLPGTTRVIALPADALAEDEHRQLRLWLRWKTSVGQA